VKEAIIEMEFYWIIDLIDESLSHDSKVMAASPELSRQQRCLDRGSLRRSSWPQWPGVF